MSRREASSPSTRSQVHAELLQEALERPGARDILRVYEGWRQADRGLHSHRAVNRRLQEIKTTDHTRPR